MKGSRTKLNGGWFAGSGINQPVEFMDNLFEHGENEVKVGRYRRRVLVQNDPTRMEKEDFDRYCKEMSGEVKITKLKENE
jgi:hypothetical protein